jgi:hypothetical protein
MLRVYLNKENLKNNTPTKYINGLTGEISNHPILESISTLLSNNTPLSFKIQYALKWKYEIH